MNLPSSAVSILLFALLLVQLQASTKYSYSFPFNSTGISPDYNLVYKLGTLSAGSSISVTVSATSGPVPIVIFQGLAMVLNSEAPYGLKYIDNTGASSVLKPVVNANGVVATIPPANSASSYSFTLPIYFPSTFSPTSAEFLMVIAADAIMANFFHRIHYRCHYLPWENSWKRSKCGGRHHHPQGR